MHVCVHVMCVCACMCTCFPAGSLRVEGQVVSTVSGDLALLALTVKEGPCVEVGSLTFRGKNPP